MGSVAFAAEDESQPSTSNGKTYKLPTTFLHGCGAVNHASIPKKQRSAVKKRGHESFTSPLLISRRKKSKVNTKKGDMSKDEEEVAQTLYALADLFSDANKPRVKSSAKPEEGNNNTLEDSRPTTQQETRKLSSSIPLKPIFPSPNSPDKDESQTLDITPSSTSRPVLSILGMNQSGRPEINLDQCGKNCSSIGDKCKDLFPSPNLSATRASSSERRSARIPSLLESTTFSSNENIITTELCSRVAPEANKSWKRCLAHAHICRLIKVLQISDGREELPLQPTKSTTYGDAERQFNISIHPRGSDRNGDAYLSAIDLFNAPKGSDIQLDKRPIQDCGKQAYDFLSLSGLDTARSGNETGCFREQFHMHSQTHPSMLSSLPHNEYSYNSAAAAQQVQVSEYHSRAEMEMESQQQKWAAQLQAHYNGGINSYAHSLFTNLHAKYQHLSPSQQQQVMAMNSNFKRPHYHLPFGFETNGTIFGPQNTAHLQLHRTGNQRL